MQYKLLKDKITDLGWFNTYEKDPTILSCFGFASELKVFPNHPEYIDVLPDIVEEYVPSGIIGFDDEDEEICPLLKNDFFFKHNKLTRRIPSSGGKYEIVDREHYVHISRLWLEPIE